MHVYIMHYIFSDVTTRDYKPEYERLKQEKAAEVETERKRQLERIKKDIAGGDAKGKTKLYLYQHIKAINISYPCIILYMINN